MKVWLVRIDDSNGDLWDIVPFDNSIAAYRYALIAAKRLLVNLGYSVPTKIRNKFNHLYSHTKYKEAAEFYLEEVVSWIDGGTVEVWSTKVKRRLPKFNEVLMPINY